MTSEEYWADAEPNIPCFGDEHTMAIIRFACEAAQEVGFEDGYDSGYFYAEMNFSE